MRASQGKKCTHDPKYFNKVTIPRREKEDLNGNEVKKKKSKLTGNNKITELFVFCKNCGIIIHKKSSKTFLFSVKPSSYNWKTETDPGILYEAYAYTDFQPILPNSPYNEKRKSAIDFLEKYNNLYKILNDDNEDIFYLAMTYMDIAFKALGEKKIKKKDFELYIINSLLLAAKFYVRNIKDFPSYEVFLQENHIYDVDGMDLKVNEVELLKLLKYKLDHHSAYDVLKFYMYNGFIYEREVDRGNPDNICTMMYNYANSILKLIMYSDIALNYDPEQIAFSVLLLTRKKFRLDDKYFTKVLKNIYNIKICDYRDCLDICKLLIDDVENGVIGATKKKRCSVAINPKFENKLIDLVKKEDLTHEEDKKEEKKNKKEIEISKINSPPPNKISKNHEVPGGKEKKPKNILFGIGKGQGFKRKRSKSFNDYNCKILEIFDINSNNKNNNICRKNDNNINSIMCEKEKINSERGSYKPNSQKKINHVY